MRKTNHRKNKNISPPAQSLKPSVHRAVFNAAANGNADWEDIMAKYIPFTDEEKHRANR